MATDAEMLATIKSQLLARITEITAQPKPNYTIDGQTISWQSYLDSLWDKVEKVEAQITSASGSFQVESFGY